VLTVGRLQKRKGHDHLIQALPAIRSGIPDVLYSIVGDGPERESLQRLVDQLGVQDAVQFRDQIDDTTLLHCYQQCDLFALPNRTVDGDFEGFGMVLLEAQACGKPVLTGTSGGTGEAMAVDCTGERVDCTDLNRISESITRLLDGRARRSSLGEAGRRLVCERFSWCSLTRQAQECFHGLAAR
jgi:phosphatidylinositol alpha-1,6-mannosyltransferase